MRFKTHTRRSQNILQVIAIIIALGAGSFLFKKTKSRFPASDPDPSVVMKSSDSKKDCAVAGDIIEDGESVNVFRFPIANQNTSCESVTRECENGVLLGNSSYASAACYDVGAQKCFFDSNQVALKGSTTFERTIEDSCIEREQLTCQEEGLFSQWSLENCDKLERRQGCQIFGRFIDKGESVVAYKQLSVAPGNVCESELRSCGKDLRLSGSFDFSNCFVQRSQNCLFKSVSYPHNQTIVAFETPEASKGKHCRSEKLTCFNGVWTGGTGFQFPNCKEL